MSGPVAPRITAAQKAARAIELRDQGCTWEEVAKQAGYSAARSANRAVTHYLASHPSPVVDDVREEEERQLLKLRRAAWQQYLTPQWATCSRGLVYDADGNPVPDYSHRDQALRILLRISESRRRLHGADKPVSIRLIEDEDAIDAEIEELISQLRSSSPLSDSVAAIGSAPGSRVIEGRAVVDKGSDD